MRASGSWRWGAGCGASLALQLAAKRGAFTGLDAAQGAPPQGHPKAACGRICPVAQLPIFGVIVVTQVPVSLDIDVVECQLRPVNIDATHDRHDDLPALWATLGPGGQPRPPHPILVITQARRLMAAWTDGVASS